jgi:hypothetical protein
MSEEEKAGIVSKNKSWILDQNNVPAHSSLTVKQFLSDMCIPVLKHSPFS